MSKNSPETGVQTPVQEQGPETVTLTKQELSNLLNRISHLEQAKIAQSVPVTQEIMPANIVNEIQTPVQAPNFIKYRISSREPSNSMQGAIIGGQLPIDSEGNVRTGFEVDKLEFQTGLKGKELQDLQEEVRIARNYIERMTGKGLGCQNKLYWAEKNIKIENSDIEYDTRNVEHMLMYYNILGGAFPEIARNRDDASSKDRFLYLDVAEQESQYATKHIKEKLKANSVLSDLLENWKREDILYLIHSISQGGKKTKGYTISTPENILMTELSNFIDGVDTQNDKKKRPREFMDMVDQFKSSVTLTRDKAKAKGLLRAAEYYGMVRQNKDKAYFIVDNDAVMGSSVQTAVEYLTNPSNKDDLAKLLAGVNAKWNS